MPSVLSGKPNPGFHGGLRHQGQKDRTSTYSDSDTSSESEYNSDGGSTAVSDCGEDEPSQDQDLEPEPSEFYKEYRNTLWNPDAQI
jgi:hypothetical protein